MKVYEILEGNTAVNIIVADEQFMLQNYPLGNYIEIIEPSEPEPVLPVWQWYIDIGPFFDRFGSAKMQVLTSSDPGVQAILKDIQVRKWIDLKIPEVSQSLVYVASKIPSVTQELQESILNTPVADSENLALRKVYF